MNALIWRLPGCYYRIVTELGSYTPETERQLAALVPETTKLVAQEKTLLGNHEGDARALLIDTLGELTDVAKSGARDYVAADVFAVIALSVAATSPEINKDAVIRYETEGGDPYYDILAVSGGYEAFTMNIPVPLLNEKFLAALKEKMTTMGESLKETDRGEHNRQFEDDPTSILNAAAEAYRALGGFAKQARVENLVGVVYSPHTEFGKQKIRAMVELIKQCREAVDKEGGIDELAKRRTEAIVTLYGESEPDWEE